MRSHRGASEPTIRKRDVAAGTPSRAARGLGWSQKTLLAWAIAGWALASLLGLVLAFQLTSRGSPVPARGSEEPAHEPSALTPAPAVPVEDVRAPEAAEGLGDAPEVKNEPERESVAHVVSQPDERSAPPARPEPKPSNDEALIAAYLRHAAVFTEAGKFDEAIEAYDRALELDPANADFRALRGQVVELANVAPGRRPTRVFKQSPTEFHGVSTDAPESFPASGSGVRVSRATRPPDLPVELVIEIVPRSAAPGDPFLLRVRLYNKGNRPIIVKSLEIVQSFDTGSGRKQTVKPLVQEINPRGTSLLWETQSVWAEAYDEGSVEVTATLIGEDRVTKRMWW